MAITIVYSYSRYKNKAIAERVPDNVRALEGALIRVVAYHSLTERPLTPKGQRRLWRITEAMTALELSFELILSSPYLRANGTWQSGSMFELGLIIGGGTAQIQKNIISERGLGMPREPKTASD